MARRRKQKCVTNGTKHSGKLKKGFRYSKSKKGCVLKARG